MRPKLYQQYQRIVAALDKQITEVQLMMRLSDGKAEFERQFEKIYGKQLQLRLQLLEDFKELTA